MRLVGAARFPFIFEQKRTIFERNDPLLLRGGREVSRRQRCMFAFVWVLVFGAKLYLMSHIFRCCQESFNNLLSSFLLVDISL